MKDETIGLLQQLVHLQKRLLECVQAKCLGTENQEWLDGTDIKQLLHISDSTLYRLVKQHQIEFRQIGGKRYYLRQMLSIQKDPQ
ncbi:hypothetical protein ACVWYG_003454 [Pedobacter sp. UYEF25]